MNSFITMCYLRYILESKLDDSLVISINCNDRQHIFFYKFNRNIFNTYNFSDILLILNYELLQLIATTRDVSRIYLR